MKHNGFYFSIVIILSGFIFEVNGEPGKGFRYIRTHPFTAYGEVEWASDSNKYQQSGLNSIMPYNTKAQESWTRDIFKMAADQSLSAHYFTRVSEWTPQELAKFVESSMQAYPNITGWCIGDEDWSDKFSQVKQLHDAIRPFAKDAIVYSVLQGMNFGSCPTSGSYVEYVKLAVKEIDPDIVIYDLYPFYNGGTCTRFFENMAIIREISQDANKPYWSWMQSHGMTTITNEPSESQMRLQAFASLTYGFTGLGFWTYSSTYNPYTNAMLDSNGNKTEMYETVANMMPEILNIGNRLRFLKSTDVYYIVSPYRHEGKMIYNQPKGTKKWSATKSYPIVDMNVTESLNGFLIGFFTDDNSELYFMLTNCQHAADKTALESSNKITIKFDETVKQIEKINRKTGKIEIIELSDHRLLDYELPGGTGDLFKFSTQRLFVGNE